MIRTLAYTLEQAETDLRNVYWHIRASRGTNWEYVNKARSIKDALRRMGITAHELANAVHCLKSTNCRRCDWVREDGRLPCWSLSKRRQRAAAAVTKRIENDES